MNSKLPDRLEGDVLRSVLDARPLTYSGPEWHHHADTIWQAARAALPEDTDVAATFETVLTILRPLLLQKIGQFETTQLLQSVRDEWHAQRRCEPRGE